MTINFQGLNPSLDFLADCMLFTNKPAYLIMDARFTDFNPADRDYWYKFLYSAHVEERKQRPDITAEDRISIENPDGIDQRVKVRFEEIAELLRQRGTNVTYRQGRKRDFLEISQGTKGDEDKLKPIRSYDVANDIGKILEVNPNLIMSYIRSRHTNHNVEEFAMNKNQIVELFQKLYEDNKRPIPLVLAAMKQFYDDLKRKAAK